MRVFSNKPKTNQEKITVHNVIISDRSGSMSGSKYNASCDSIIKELEILSKDDSVNYTQTVVEFDDYRGELRMINHYWLDKSNPVIFRGHGASGGTPLYRCLGEVLTKLEKEVSSNDRVLIKIFTDGQDTDITRYVWNQTTIKTLIDRLVNENKWTITFNCTHTDKQRIIEIGIPESNILCHNNTSEDIERVTQMRTSSTMYYSKSVADGVSADVLSTSFYSKTLN